MLKQYRIIAAVNENGETYNITLTTNVGSLKSDVDQDGDVYADDAYFWYTTPITLLVTILLGKNSLQQIIIQFN